MTRTYLLGLKSTFKKKKVLGQKSYLETVFKLLADKIESDWIYTRVHGCQVDADVIQWQQETGQQESKIESKIITTIYTLQRH